MPFVENYGTVREAALKILDHLAKQLCVWVQMCMFKSYSLNNHENGEVRLKLTPMGRSWREPDLEETLYIQEIYNLKNLLNLLNHYFPNLFDHGTFNFSGLSVDVSHNIPQNTVWEIMSQVTTSRFYSVFMTEANS